MGNAHDGRDDLAFFAADIGDTWDLAVTAAGEDLDDDIGALPPGRYLVQAVLSDPLAECWLHVGPWVAGEELSKAASQGRRRFPLTATVPAVEFNVRKADSDRVGAVMTGAFTGTLHISRISVVAR